MNIDDLITSLLKLKNEGCKEATIDPRSRHKQYTTV